MAPISYKGSCVLSIQGSQSLVFNDCFVLDDKETAKEVIKCFFQPSLGRHSSGVEINISPINTMIQLPTIWALMTFSLFNYGTRGGGNAPTSPDVSVGKQKLGKWTRSLFGRGKLKRGKSRLVGSVHGGGGVLPCLTRRDVPLNRVPFYSKIMRQGVLF